MLTKTFFSKVMKAPKAVAVVSAIVVAAITM
jgi:hypothetical protein